MIRYNTNCDGVFFLYFLLVNQTKITHSLGHSLMTNASNMQCLRMFCNQLFTADQRIHNILIYQCLTTKRHKTVTKTQVTLNKDGTSKGLICCICNIYNWFHGLIWLSQNSLWANTILSYVDSSRTYVRSEDDVDDTAIVHRM